VTSEKRVSAFPDVPTAAEAGLKDFNILSFIGLYGPPGLPADIVKKANHALNTALQDPTIMKGIFDCGDEPGGGTPHQLGALTRNQYKSWGDAPESPLAEPGVLRLDALLLPGALAERVVRWLAGTD
jgi:tripartite-type tricarboxylate transporter receptor subunit TctC